MSNSILMLAFVLAAFQLQAQVKTPAPSPKATVKQVVGLTDVEIEYSRPSMKGRTIFGDLVPFGKMWRTGANQNSMVSFSEDVVIAGKTLPKGKYALFTVPKADAWDVIFYTDTENWGTPEKWDDAKVAVRTSVKPEMLSRAVESFTIGVNNLDNNYGQLEISWEKTLVPIKFEVPTAKTAMASIQNTLSGTTATANDYFSAAQYLNQSNGDMKQALAYVNKAIEMHKDKPFYMYRQKSLIQAKLGDKKGAIETAKTSLAGAEKAGNADYVKMNKDSIAEWSK
jgi:hypothetical protein